MANLRLSELDRDIHNYDDKVRRYDWSTKASLFNSRLTPISINKQPKPHKRVDLLYCSGECEQFPEIVLPK